MAADLSHLHTFILHPITLSTPEVLGPSHQIFEGLHSHPINLNFHIKYYIYVTYRNTLNVSILL